MIEIIKNVDNLIEDDITDFTTKVKLLMVNSSGELLLGYSNHEYQFPGGTQEAGETLNDTVKREMMEETGIMLGELTISPFLKSSGYYKNWPSDGKNKKVEIYYYEIKTDVRPNLEKVRLTEKEKEGNFTLKYIPLVDIKKELENNVKMYGDPHGITSEMKQVLEIYVK